MVIWRLPWVRRLLPLAILAVMVFPVSGAHAAEVKKAPSDNDVGPSELGTLSIKFENDLFAGTDRHYTNGLRISWLSPEGGKAYAPLQAIEDFLQTFAQKYHRDKTRFGWAIGQDIFTPEDRFRADLIEDDRPYAGWLYGSLSLHTITADKDNSSRKTSESVELSLGIVGPQAMGEETQDFVHDLRLIDNFEGWDHQLRAEPGLMLRYERKWRFRDPVPHGNYLEADWIPRVALSLGNVMTHASFGASVRMGFNLPRDFGPPGLIQGAEPLSALDDRPHGNWSIYGFLTAEGRIVGHNIFLDGNTFRDSHSVDKKRWVGDLAAGVAVIYERFTIAYTNALRTKEFEGQRRPSRFGSITASFQAFF